MRDKQSVFYAFILSSAIHIAGIGALGGFFNFPIKSSMPKTQVVELDEKKSPLLPEIRVIGEIQKIVPQENKPQDPAAPEITDLNALAVKPPEEIKTKDIEAEKAMLRYQDMIKQRIETFRKYPLRARQNQIQGVVGLKFQVFSGGSTASVQIVQSSGSEILDTEALNTIKRASPFLPIPNNIHQNEITIHVSIIFSLK